MKQDISEESIEQRDYEKISKRLAQIAKKHAGRLTPEAVVEDAKDPNSPLHICFEWNVKKAAYQHWVRQARDLIRRVRVDIHTDKIVVQSVAYVRDPDLPGREQGYIAVDTLRSEKEIAREVLKNEFKRIADLLVRVNEIAIAAGLGSEVAAIHEKVLGVQAKLVIESR